MSGLNRFIIVVVVLGGVFAWRQFHPASSFAADGEPNWDRAVQISQSTGRPGLVLFTAKWCGACQQLHARVLSDENVEQTIAKNYTMVTVDMTTPDATTAARADKCGVNAYPTLIRYDKNGRETGRTHGMSPSDLVKWLGE